MEQITRAKTKLYILLVDGISAYSKTNSLSDRQRVTKGYFQQAAEEGLVEIVKLKKKKKGEARALRVFEEVEEAEEAKEDEVNEENEGLIEEVDSLDDLPACCIPS